MPKIIKDGVVYGASPSENVWEGTMDEYNAIPVKDPNTAYYITDEDPYPNTNAGVISYDNTNSGLSAVDVQQAIDETVANKVDISKFITEIYSGTSAQTTGDSISLNKSVSNFRLILIRFASSANDMTYQLVHANEPNTIFQTLSANGTDGQATYPLGFNTTMAYKLNGNKIDIIRLNYNQSGWKLKIVNVYGILDRS